jgi:hypothetical protein
VVTEDEDEKSLGGVGQAVLSYTGELARGSLTAYRDLRFAGGTTGATERTGVVLDLSRRFTYELQGGLSASYFRNKADPDEFAATEKIDDRTVNFGPRLRYDLSRNLALEASYTYTRIEDRVDDDHAERNLVFIRVIFEYPMFE